MPWFPDEELIESTKADIVMVNGKALGCCYLCGYIGTEQQSHCPKCQPGFQPGNGDFYACSLSDIYSLMVKQQIRVEVYRGCADVSICPERCEVDILDHDNESIFEDPGYESMEQDEHPARA